MGCGTKVLNLTEDVNGYEDVNNCKLTDILMKFGSAESGIDPLI